jgi:sugar lactone lactonase YvrE
MGGFEPVLRIEALLGECPRWSAREGVLYWADILGKALHRFDPATGEDWTMALDEEIGCFAEREAGGFVAGLRSGIWLLGPDGSKQEKVASPEAEPERARFNDGRADPWGGFWAGTMWEPRDRPGASLYRLTRERELVTLQTGVIVSNGTAFSPDRRWGYHSDSRAMTIWRYPLDPDSGAPTGPRQVFRTMGEERPDGAAVDAEGCYWSALFGSGRVVRLSPEGEEIGSWSLPVPNTTMPCFGGKDLRTLYVTTAREGMDEVALAATPLAGSLFAMEVDVEGLPEPRFAG